MVGGIENMKFIKFGSNIVNTKYITYIYKEYDYDIQNDHPYEIVIDIDSSTTLRCYYVDETERNRAFNDLHLQLIEE